MIIYDGEYHWEGWGGKLRLGHGKCRLVIVDLPRSDGTVRLKSHVVVTVDLSDSPTRIRNYGGHIATGVVAKFNIHPRRMIWVEYYPEERFGIANEKIIPERFDETEFEWVGAKALQPRWKPLAEPLLGQLKQLLADHHIRLT